MRKENGGSLGKAKGASLPSVALLWGLANTLLYFCYSETISQSLLPLDCFTDCGQTDTLIGSEK